MAENDTLVFPEIGQFEDPHTGNMVTGELMVTDQIEEIQISPGGFEALDEVGIAAEEGERVFQLAERGAVPESDIGAKQGRNEVGPEDVFVRPAKMQNQPPDPRKVHQSRSEYAQKQDEARDARLTTDRRKYATNSDSFDFPGVDTGPQFRSVEGNDFNTESFLDSLF